MPDPQVAARPVSRLRDGRFEGGRDEVAVEAPLETRVDGRAVAVTLRTPGHDRELALGFLAGEGLISRPSDVRDVRETPASCADEADAIEIALAEGVRIDWSRLERHFAATSACGLCGRAHLESLRSGLTPMAVASRLPVPRLTGLDGRLRDGQAAFAATGGIHAAALCSDDLEPLVLREDVGRHNAVDKVAGWLLHESRYPAEQGLLWVSGRAGAEIVLKAARARIPAVAAVGAPSTLAVALAEAAGMTLVGFLREGRMNVYSGVERLAP